MHNNQDLLKIGVEQNKIDKKEYDFNYLLQALRLFHNAREESKLLLNRYATRIEKQITDYRFLFLPESQSDYNFLNKRRKFFLFLKATFKTIRQIIFFLSQIPTFISQKRKIDAAHSDKSEFKNVIIGKASRRLYFSGHHGDPREYLVSLMQSMPKDGAKNRVMDDVKDAKYIYIFDPLISSLMWVRKKECWRHGIFIADLNFLVFIFFTNMHKTIPKLIGYCVFNKEFYSSFKSAFRLSFQPIRNLLASILMMESYKTIIDQKHNIDAYLVTSNSFSTEVLRFFLIQNEACDFICEILHGVPSVEFEQYLSKLLALGSSYGASEKHNFIFQIPNLPLYGVFDTLDKQKNEIAINTYINKYLSEISSTGYSLLGYIESQIKPLLPAHVIECNSYIIGIMGASSHESDYFQSNAFKLECLAIKKINKIAKKLNKSICILYTPHPCHAISGFYMNSFLKEEHVIIYHSTIFSWFVSDMCMALYSSALFEASYFGIPAFTPMTIKDEFYPEKLLNLLHYSELNKNFLDEFDSFVSLHVTKDKVSIKDKISTRVALI